MKYDVYILQVLQEALDHIKEISYAFQGGICNEMRSVECKFYRDIQCWMRDRYMPHKLLNTVWWPLSMEHPDEILEQSKQDRIAFLERIIEDLMCGE